MRRICKNIWEARLCQLGYVVMRDLFGQISFWQIFARLIWTNIFLRNICDHVMEIQYVKSQIQINQKSQILFKADRWSETCTPESWWQSVAWLTWHQPEPPPPHLSRLLPWSLTLPPWSASSPSPHCGSSSSPSLSYSSGSRHWLVGS